MACRICLFETNSDEDPLITPCKCAGTMKFIHLNCLKEWLNQKRVKKPTRIAAMYTWKILECELCKLKFPDKVSVNGKNYDLLDIDRPEDGPYMLLELISASTSHHAARSFHMVSLAEKSEIKVGRGHDTDVRVTDISVSRVHAFFRVTDTDKVFLEDNNSKFGTLSMI